MHLKPAFESTQCFTNRALADSFEMLCLMSSFEIMCQMQFCKLCKKCMILIYYVWHMISKLSIRRKRLIEECRENIMSKG